MLVASITHPDRPPIHLSGNIGAANERYERYRFYNMIWVVACRRDSHRNQLFELLELAKSLVYDRLMAGKIVRKGTVPALGQVFKEAADVCMSQYRSAEPTTGLELTSSEIGIAQIQDMTAKRYVHSFLSFFSSFLRTPG